jgi:hypothetical protein
MEFTSTPIIFVSGRMNPPTPGHIKLIMAADEKASKLGGIVKVYITQSVNKSTIEEICGFDEECKKRKKGEPKYVSVKHPRYQNPLSPEVKKEYIEKMLSKQSIKSNIEVVNDPKCNGVFQARLCALRMQPDPNKVFFVMGEELDDIENASRQTFCEKDDNIEINNENPGMQKVHCIPISRTNSRDISGMSGSKVRNLAVQNDNESMQKLYNGYLELTDIHNLIQKIRTGVNLTEVMSDDIPSKRLRTQGGIKTTAKARKLKKRRKTSKKRNKSMRKRR